MARRQVKCTTKDSMKEVTHVGGQDNYGIRFYESEPDAIHHIENGIHTYFTYADGHQAEVNVVIINGRKHLRTSSDGTTRNNLSKLPDC
ncbi:Protein of unknown function [Reichenbachiella faecimaris]|uniref:DUF3892 domain-containing protein n=1 Tax=Reichenbachiella faecimaris TaxID=692418 RepID=A0A1W2GHA8_REIFA|nr:DUF3892 domain-containing protein [Reichenbachiella faecimaris]SMD36053.1 Protein of unknown function [Reichenbachiella faecimaris]